MAGEQDERPTRICNKTIEKIAGPPYTLAINMNMGNCYLVFV